MGPRRFWYTGEAVDSFDNPVLLFFQLLLSIVSGWFLWRGFKEKHVSTCLYGVGTTLPTFAVSDWRAWIAGGLICAGGFWLQRNMDL